MNNKEKAKIILESLDSSGTVQVNWNFAEYYIKSIIEALEAIDKEEKKCQQKNIV